VVDDVLPILATMTVAIRDFGGAGLADLLDTCASKPGHVVDVVALHWAGDAIRIRFVDADTDMRPDVGQCSAVFQWLVPVPADTRVCVITFATPNTGRVLTEGMANLFAAIVETFEYVASSDSRLLD
jgi:hypothetical protein